MRRTREASSSDKHNALLDACQEQGDLGGRFRHTLWGGDKHMPTKAKAAVIDEMTEKLKRT
ncbi:MAG: hypothetical protein ACXVCO_06790, partial [Ktedonobacterales bacterium]